MSITATEFKTRFTEFSAIADATIEIFIEDSVLMINETHWGDKYDLGLYYLSAHYLSLSILSGSGNTSSVLPQSGKSVDGTSVSFSSPSYDDGNEAYYNSTTYGQRFWSLIRSLGVGACVV